MSGDGLRRSGRVAAQPRPAYEEPLYEGFGEDDSDDGAFRLIPPYHSGRSAARDTSFNPSHRARYASGGMSMEPPNTLYELLRAAAAVELSTFAPGDYQHLRDIQPGDREVYVPSRAEVVPRRALLGAEDLADPERNSGVNMPLYMSPSMSVSGRRASQRAPPSVPGDPRHTWSSSPRPT